MNSKGLSVLFGLFFFLTIGYTQIPPGYYNNAAFKTGEDLKQALHDIIDDHTIIAYSNLWIYFSSTDATASNQVWDIYSSVSAGSPAYVYNFTSDQCGNYNSEGDCYNREHSMPKSWFNDLAPMNSDLFHIYPTDGYVNGLRSNNPYGEVGTVSTTTTNGSKVGSSNYPGYSGTVFEPIDAYKGDLARTYFYMMTRYKDVSSNWSSDMLSAGDLSMWAENMLLDWHLADTVSQKEIDRNDKVYSVQGNRNPFIDHPEWVEYIWGPIADTDQNYNVGFSAYYYNNMIYIHSEDPSVYTIQIIDAGGRLVLNQITRENKIEIAPGLPKGFYSITIATDSVLYKFKIVR